MTSDTEKRIIEELTPDELAPLLYKTPYDPIVINFVSSGKRL